MTAQYSYYELSIAAAVSCAVLLALLLIKVYAARQLRRLSTVGRLGFLSYPEQIVAATRFPFMLIVSLLAGVSQLKLPAEYDRWLHYAWIIILISQIAMWASRIVTVAVERAFDNHKQTDPSGATHLMLAGLIARIVLWSIALLVMLDNLGFNITTLMASLGIGGIAVALAVQNILGDVFSSVSIALDKPFVIGDFIVVDDLMGTVEYVGLKTTRLRSLGGEQIIFSNTELLKNRIRNYKRMQERRVQFGFGIAYETPIEHIRKIPGVVKQIIMSSPEAARFDRAHFKGYGESSLDFEVVYYVLSADYNKYMDIQQQINLALLEHFHAHQLSFAYPTRTLYVASNAAVDAAQSGPENDEKTGARIAEMTNS